MHTISLTDKELLLIYIQIQKEYHQIQELQKFTHTSQSELALYEGILAKFENSMPGLQHLHQ